MTVSFDLFLLAIGLMGFIGYSVGYYVSTIQHRTIFKKYFKGIK